MRAQGVTRLLNREIKLHARILPDVDGSADANEVLQEAVDCIGKASPTVLSLSCKEGGIKKIKHTMVHPPLA